MVLSFYAVSSIGVIKLFLIWLAFRDNTTEMSFKQFILFQLQQQTMPRTLTVCITGAAGKIAYSLYNTLCSSDVFGSEIQIILRLVEIEQKLPQLEIVKMELQDCCYIRVKSIQIYSDLQQNLAFQDVDVVIFLGSRPRQPGMDRWEVFENNAKLFEEHGKNINMYAKKTCKCLVVSNPPNTNCTVLAYNAPSIPKQNFTSLNRLDYNRFMSHICNVFKCNKKKVKNLFIWGNHSKYQFCDASFLEIEGVTQEQIREKLKNFDSRAVEKQLHSRGGFIADKMGSGAHMSAAKSIIDHLRDWFMNSQKLVSMGVITTKEIYGIPEGLCFSLPVLCLGEGSYKIWEQLLLNEEHKARIAESRQELEQQKTIVQKYLATGLKQEPST